jgi:hypothetical protein
MSDPFTHEAAKPVSKPKSKAKAKAAVEPEVPSIVMEPMRDEDSVYNEDEVFDDGQEDEL